MSVCRVCLCSDPRKDIIELGQIERRHNYGDMMKFCLDIQVSEQSKITTKLCTKCFEKIIDFCSFKSLALKSDAHLRNLDLQSLKVEFEDDSEILDNESQTNENLNLFSDLREETFEINDLQCIVDEPCIDIIKEESLDLGDLPRKKAASPCPSDNKISNKVHEVKTECNLIEWFDIESENITNITYEYIDLKENVQTKKRRNKSQPSNLKRREYKKKYRESKQLDICPQCGKQVKDLKNHMLTHFSYDQRKKFKCDLCYKVFQTVQGKNRHMSTHSANAKKQCSICKTEVLYLNAHMKTVHQPEARRFQCVSCGQKFISPAALSNHISVHTNDKPYQCEICGQNFRTNRLLNIHKRRMHFKEKCFQCDICSKSFFKKEILKEHIRIHTKERPYKCTECDKDFTSSNGLRNHRFTHAGHTYNCTICDMKFSTPKYVQTHMKTHSKEKRYPCQYCSVAFYRSDHRNRHVKTAHPKENAEATATKTS